MAARVLVVAATLSLVVGACASRARDDEPRCELHDRPLVVRRTTVDTATYCGVPIDGYDEARATMFPNRFSRPTRGEHGVAATAAHCVACTVARAEWLDETFGVTLPGDRDGFVDARRSLDAETRTVSEALDVALLAHGAPVVARSFDGVNGYARIGDTDVGVTEVWWDRTPVAGHTDVAVRTSPHDEDAARALLDALAAALVRER